MHLLKRKNTYYYKLKIPKDLQKLIPLNEVRFSLYTKSKKEAVYLASIFTSKYYTLFSQLRSGLYSENEVVTLINTGLYLNLSQLNLNIVNKCLPKVYTLQELSNMYTNDKMITNTWADKTLKTYEFIFEVFSKVVTVNQDVKAITRADLQSFKATLIQLPPTKQSYLTKDITEILDIGLNSMFTTTAQKYLCFIVAGSVSLLILR